jgi:hypothetical protein
VPWPDSTQVRARLELEFREDPDRRAPPVSEREKRRACGLAGPGEELAGWACRAVREKGRGRKRGRLGLGRKEGKIGKGEKESGLGPKRKRGRKRIAFKYI